MTATMSASDIRSVASWPMLIEAIREGHRRPPASIADSLVDGEHGKMLVRSAWIDGLAAGIKAATVVPANVERDPPLPSVHASVVLFDTQTGVPIVTLDGTEITPWKTAADSALGSQLLSRENSKTFVMIGAGAMARPLIDAHRSVRPSIDTVLVWNRSAARGENLVRDLQKGGLNAQSVSDLDEVVAQADIVCCATMSDDPVLQGKWLSPGTHVDLVGAYTPTMREADDETHRVGRWFVDSRATTLEHIGELKIPLETGVIDRSAIQGDLHELVSGDAGRGSESEITVFKNGGGAHLDIMVSAALYAAHRDMSSDG